MDSERAQRMCRATCRHRVCTGRGDTSRWAHTCQLAPPVQRDPDPCDVLGCTDLSVGRIGSGAQLCAGHLPVQPCPDPGSTAAALRARTLPTPDQSRYGDG